MKSKSLFLALSLLLCSCTTVGGMENTSPKGGMVQLYEAPYRTVFDLALHACQVLDFKINSTHYEQKFIVASNGMSAFSYGERVGIYFREVDKNQTEVRIISKAKVKTNIFAPRWASEIHQLMQARLNQLKEAKVVP